MSAPPENSCFQWGRHSCLPLPGRTCESMNITTFIHATHWEDLSPAVHAQTTRCLLDTPGAGIGGRATDTARIIHDFAATCFGGGDALLWQDGRRASPAGAALANGATIDSLDIH